MNERPDEDLYDVKVLLAASHKHLLGQDLDQEERNIVSAMMHGLEEITAGVPTEDELPPS